MQPTLDVIRRFPRLLVVFAIAVLSLSSRPATAQSGGQCPTPPVATVDLTALQNAVTAAENALANATFLANGKQEALWAAQQAMWNAQAALQQAQMMGNQAAIAAAAAAASAARLAYLAALSALDQAMGAVMAAQSALTAAETALANAIAASGLTAAQLACYGIIVAEVAVVATECYLIYDAYNTYTNNGGTNFTGELFGNYIYYCKPWNW